MATRKRKAAAAAAAAAAEEVAKRGRGEPPDALPFVTVEGETFSVNPDAVKFLESLGDKPLAVVALAGPYRHGKSFLLNRVILEHPPGVGFQVGQTVNACTKGLHISTKVLPASNAADGDYAILVIDTEGLGATTADETHDSRIFSFALLLASLFIYNSKGTIDQQAISTLSVVANMTEHIRTSSDDGDGDIGAFMPAFLWVVRDFSLALEDEAGGEITEAQYLENALQRVPGAPDEKNKVRDTLRGYFRHRDCITMSRPCDDKAIKTLNEQPDAVLNPAFVEQAQQLRDKLGLLARPKQACGTRVTGALLARLAKVYADAINKGAAPAIKDSWSLISADECGRAVQAAAAAFSRHLADNGADGTATDDAGDRVAVPSPKLEALFTQGSEQALALFKKLAIGDRAEDFREKLRDALRERITHLRSENNKLIARKAEAACAGFEAELLDYVSFEVARKEHAELQARFFKQVGSGPTCQAAWNEHTAKRLWDWASRYHAELATACAAAEAKVAALEKAEAKAAKAEEKLGAALEAAVADAAELKRRVAELEQAAVADAGRADRLQRELDEQLETVDEADAKHREELAQLRADLTAADGRVAAAEAQLAAAQREADRVRTELEQIRAESDERSAELEQLKNQTREHLEREQQVSKLQAECGALGRKVANLNGMLDRDAEEHRAKMTELAEASRATVQQLQTAKKKALADAAAATKQKRAAEDAAKAQKKEADARAVELRKALRKAEDAAESTATQAAAERAAAKQELADVRTEASKNAKTFQEQLDAASAQHRDEARKAAAKAREKQEALFQEKVSEASRAQNAEGRAALAEAALKEAREQLDAERKRAREQNHAGKVSDLEHKLTAADAKCALLEKELASKADAVADHETTITRLEADLRQIEHRHSAQIMRLELDHARQMESK